jgi:hypothetical protein
MFEGSLFLIQLRTGFSRHASPGLHISVILSALALFIVCGLSLGCGSGGGAIGSQSATLTPSIVAQPANQSTPMGLPGRGIGLISMQERLKILKGTLLIDSLPKRGTTIHAFVPINPGSLSER